MPCHDPVQPRLQRIAQMNTSRVEAFMRAILAASKALGTGPPPEEKTDNVAVLSDLLAQREEMFQFDVLERAYNRQLMRLDNLGNRVGVLLAAQIAIASVLTAIPQPLRVGRRSYCSPSLARPASSSEP